MAEDMASSATGRLLGTADFQRQVDSLADSAKSIDKSIKELLKELKPTASSPAQNQIRGRQSIFQRMVGHYLNGGEVTWKGVAASALFETQGTEDGKHRAEGPATTRTSTTAANATHRAQPPLGNGVGAALVAGSAVSSAASAVSNTIRFFGRDPLDKERAQELWSTVLPMLYQGRTPNYGMSNFQKWGGAAMGDADQAAASLGTMQHSGYAWGTPGANRYMTSAAVNSTINPTMSLADSENMQAPFYTVQGFNSLRPMGIRTIDKHGRKKSVTLIASQILNMLDPKKYVTTDAQIEWFVNDPQGRVTVLLGNYVANQIITPEQAESLKNQIKALLYARRQGVGARELYRLMEQSNDSSNPARAERAQSRLNQLGFNNTKLASDKEQEASARDNTFKDLQTYIESAIRFNESQTAFNRRLLDMIPDWGRHVQRFVEAAINNPAGAYIDYYRTGFKGVKTAVDWVLNLGNNDGGGKSSSPRGLPPFFPPLDFDPAKLKPQGGSNELNMSRVAAGSPYMADQSRTGAVGISSAGSSFTSSPHVSGGAGVGGGGVGMATSNEVSSGQVSGTTMGWPTRSRVITSPFGVRRANGKIHTGVDFRASTGTPVYAAADGFVLSKQSIDGSYGKYLIINHGNNVWTLYAHNSNIMVNQGQQVRKGQQIAQSGATGNVTGPHVHFEILINKKPVDPMRYLGTGATINVANAGSVSSLAGASSSGVTSSAVSVSMPRSASGTGSGLFGSELAALMSGIASTMTGMDSPDGGSQAAAVDSGGAIPTAPHIRPGSHIGMNIMLGKKMARDLGWYGSQWDALYDLWMSESSWNEKAKNASSGAYGIPQSLPANKMASSGKDWRTNPATQIAWGLQYIRDRYRNPSGAWRFKQARGYYAKGAWELQQDEIATVHKGEMIIPAKPAQTIREVLLNNGPNTSSGSGQVVLEFKQGSINVTVNGSGSKQQGRELGKSIVDAITNDKRIRDLKAGRIYG